MIIPSYDVQSNVRLKVHHLTPKASANKPVVLMCHPTGFCGLAYASVTAHLRNANVFALDARSHGESDRGSLTSWNGFQKDLDSVFDFLKDFTKHNNFIGLGISSGASAHILNASINKDLYSGLYLSEPILFPPGTDLAHRESLALSARRRRDSFGSYDEAFFKYKDKGALSHLSKSALGLYVSNGFELLDNSITLKCNKEDEEAIYLSGTANGVWEALSNIDVSSLIVYGEHSNTVTLALAQKIAHQMKKAKIEMMPNVGHFTLFEQPYNAAKSITNFINSIA
ncbi:MAG: alpha/beta hydrolase [Acidimicrobiia bacterium]